MNPTLTAARHLHLDIELNPENQFHYRIRGEDTHRVVLHRGDAITFTCADPFSIHFSGRPPFHEGTQHSHREAVLQAHEWFVTAHVREDAPFGIYPYAVEVTRDSHTLHDHPEIVIDSAA